MTNIIRTKIVGVSKTNPDGTSRQDIIRDKVTDVDGLVLEREPENKYDPNAIAVFLDGGLDDYLQLGYLSSELSAKLAPIMDSGRDIDAEVTQVTGREEDSVGVNIQLTVLTAEETKSRNARIPTRNSRPAPVPQSPSKVTKPRPQKVYVVEKSNKSFLALVLYWIFLGYFGGHRFYAGRGSLLYTLTIGYFMIGWIIDGFLIFTGMFKDGRGIEIKP